MYLDHFHLKKEPFGIVPDPEFMWLGRQQARALETLSEGVFDRDGCPVLTGDIGTGKTILVKRMVAREDVVPIFVTVGGRELTGLDFCRLLADELHMRRGFQSREEFMSNLAQELPRTFGPERNVIIVIDEAQRLTRDALKDLAVLADLRSNGKRLLKMLLVGQLGFDAEALLGMQGGSAAGVAVRCRLEPLSAEDTQSYIAHRLKVAGCEKTLFSPDAVREIHTLSRGFPRLINIICDHALLYGYSANLERIDHHVIRDCSRDLSVALGLDDVPNGPLAAAAIEAPAGTPRSTAADAPPPRRWRSWLYLAVAMAAAGGAFYFLFSR